MVEILKLDRWDGPAPPEVRARALETLEGAGIVYLPRHGFAIGERERAFFDPEIVNQPRQHSGRARIIFESGRGKTRRSKLAGDTQHDMEAMVARFCAWSRDLVVDLFPDYEDDLAVGPTTFRPCARTGPQGLHVDAFFFFPTEGRRIIRLFTNVNPTGEPRVWQVGEQPFEPFARDYLPRLRRDIPGSGWFLERAGITNGRRTPYDHAMRQLRNLAKRDEGFQREAPRSFIEFPPGATWIVFPDQVLHGAMTGQFAFEQTFLLPVEALHQPLRSPLRVLERLTGRALA